MKRFIGPIVAIITILASDSAIAGTTVLGAEIGTTTAEQLKQVLSRHTRVFDQGVNKYSGGPMLATDGSSYEIEGLEKVLYIFDKQGKLAGVIMDMDKDRFVSIYQVLRQKYKLISEQRPFVGNQYARFKPVDALIELDAPHLSFTMEVRYIRNDLMQKFNADSTTESALKKKTEAEKF